MWILGLKGLRIKAKYNQFLLVQPQKFAFSLFNIHFGNELGNFLKECVGKAPDS